MSVYQPSSAAVAANIKKIPAVAHEGENHRLLSMTESSEDDQDEDFGLKKRPSPTSVAGSAAEKRHLKKLPDLKLAMPQSSNNLMSSAAGKIRRKIRLKR